jgi:amidophosphoribosyltransferase
VRYSTTGSSRWPNAQPVVRHNGTRTVALGHNGNLTNTAELREELAERGVRLETTSDTEVIAAIICEHPGPIEDGRARGDVAHRGRVLGDRARPRAQ